MNGEMKQKGSIGVFDSGFGGLNILKGIVKQLPDYNYIYLGDTARAPYGARSQEVIYEFTVQAVDFLFKQGCELIILACNTASSDALRKIQQEYLPAHYPDRRVLGVIIPAAEVAAEVSKVGSVGVVATSATVSSGAFKREIAKVAPNIKVKQNACPLLVPIIELGEQNSKGADVFLKSYLLPLKKAKIDTLILGCTHYGIIERKIQAMMGKNVQILSEAKIVPRKLKEYLMRHVELEGRLGKGCALKFYTTDLTEKFVQLGSKFFGQQIAAEKVELR